MFEAHNVESKLYEVEGIGVLRRNRVWVAESFRELL